MKIAGYFQDSLRGRQGSGRRPEPSLNSSVAFLATSTTRQLRAVQSRFSDLTSMRGVRERECVSGVGIERGATEVDHCVVRLGTTAECEVKDPVAELDDQYQLPTAGSGMISRNS
jgi:hypothetical protein